MQATWQSAVFESLPGTSVPVSVWRDGKLVTEKVKLRNALAATRVNPWNDALAVIAGEMVFMALSIDLLHRWGEEWSLDAPPDLVKTAMQENAEDDNEVVVVVGKAKTKVEAYSFLTSRWGVGEDGKDLREDEKLKKDLEKCEEFNFLRVTKVNGNRVTGLQDLARNEREGEEIVVEFANGFVAAVPNGKVLAVEGKWNLDAFDMAT